MSHPTGTIKSISTGERGTRAIVEVDVRAVCPRCAAGKGCGAGLLAGTDRTRTVEATVLQNLELHTGDSVELRLAPTNLLAAAGIVYGLPLLGAIVAAGGAYFMRQGDAAAAAAAVAGVIVGLMISRHKLRQADCINDLVPTVEKKLRNAVD
jgi:sigma-E factor negative regulatory protein RseC